jgi:hypothetical protein
MIVMHTVTDASSPQPAESTTELELLLAQASSAPPGRRIELRDPIAAHGVLAIEGVRPWLRDETLAAFAVRVIEKVGIDGAPEKATEALRAARKQVPEAVSADVEWALERLKAASRPAPAPAPAPAAPARRPVPRPTTTSRRRTS